MYKATNLPYDELLEASFYHIMDVIDAIPNTTENKEVLAHLRQTMVYL